MLSCNSRATRPRSASCACTTRCVKARSSSSFRRASVMSVTTMPMVARLKPFLASGRMEICTGICEPSPAWSSTWILEPDLPARFRSGRSVARSSAERKRRKELPDHLLQRAFDHAGEALVGVENHLVRRQRQRPFVHGFDEHAVGVLGAFQREHLRALLARDHHRIHFAGANGAERFLRFGQAGAELGELRADGARRAAERGLAAGSFQRAILAFRDQVQLDEQAGDVRQVADEPAHRPGEFLDERRGRDDLVVARQDRAADRCRSLPARSCLSVRLRTVDGRAGWPGAIGRWPPPRTVAGRICPRAGWPGPSQRPWSRGWFCLVFTGVRLG